MAPTLPALYRPEFVMARVDVIEACGGDANLAVIHAYIEFRLRDYEADRKRANPSRDYRADDDGRVWLRCTTAELGAALGQSPRTMPSRLERLVAGGLLDRMIDGNHRWYAPGARRVDHAPSDVAEARESRASRRADHAPPRRADHAPAAGHTFLVQEGVEEGEEPTASASLDASPGTALAVVEATPRSEAERWVRMAWDERVAHGKPRPELAGKGSPFLALVKITERLIAAGHDPREVGLAIFHNDGAWTIAALQEQMRRRRGASTGREAPSDQVARVAAMMNGGRS